MDNPLLSFSVDEIIEMAQDLERAGEAFYRRTAALATDAPIRDALLQLAEMEAAHLQVFSRLREELPGELRVRPSRTPGEAGEHSRYTHALVRAHAFGPAPEARLASPLDVLRRAVELEKDAIVFLLDLQELVPLRQGRREVERILDEERRHVRTLNALITARSV